MIRSGAFTGKTFQSTHPLRGATRGRTSWSGWGTFQSTHPLRGATLSRLSHLFHDKNFNPRTPCGVRRGSTDQALQVIEISIHAPLAGCDRPYPALRRCQANFNPRTPCGVRPDHSPPRRQQRYFNPRTPCGVRRTFYRRVKDYEGFQSTHPLRGATKRQLRAKLSDDISIHAPLAGCDLR